MAIQYAILGFLSWRALSGYDLKKMFGESLFFHWSGNSNQIYKTLVQLQKQGLVTCEILNQECGPSKKVYTITQKGLVELRTWVMTSPDSPQLRNAFLVQLAWADQLTPAELDALIDTYEHEVHMQMLMCEEQARRNQLTPARTERETYLWHMISDNWIGYYKAELVWIGQLKEGLKGQSAR